MMPLWLRGTKRLGFRLALSYMAVLIAALLVFIAGTALILFAQMRAQLWHYAIQDVETVEGLISFSSSGSVALRDDYHNHPESKRVVDRFLEILSPAGDVLYRNEQLGQRTLGGSLAAGEGTGGYSQRAFRFPDGMKVLMVSRRHVLNGRPLIIRLGYSEVSITEALDELIAAALLMLPVMLVLAALAGQRMSRKVLDPVERITRQAEQITSQRLHERIPLNGSGDELDHLAAVFNQTLARLDQSFQQLRQFTADASHELRTPLAVIRSLGEVGLHHDRTGEQYRELIGSMLEESSRLARLTDDLLMISRADAGVIPLHRSVISLSALARETATLLDPLAQEKKQNLILPRMDEARVTADPVFTRQAILNVLHNAIKYSPPRTTILMSVERTAENAVTIAVRDSGPGIAAEHQERIFNRFYRIDGGRSRDSGGFGLGLAIAHWAVEANGGSITVASEPGDGATFRITFPVAGAG